MPVRWLHGRQKLKRRKARGKRQRDPGTRGRYRHHLKAHLCLQWRELPGNIYRERILHWWVTLAYITTYTVTQLYINTLGPVIMLDFHQATLEGRGKKKNNWPEYAEQSQGTLWRVPWDRSQKLNGIPLALVNICLLLSQLLQVRAISTIPIEQNCRLLDYFCYFIKPHTLYQGFSHWHYWYFELNNSLSGGLSCPL